MQIPALNDARYEILDKLGEGAFGVVYEAHDSVLDHRVALKTLKSVSLDHIMDLKSEFRSLRGVYHPNLVQLYELASRDGQLFFTMERLWGQSFLDAHRHEDQVDFGRLRYSTIQLAKGLSVLHGLGKVHRDIKPSNVIVEPEGRAVLVDFGFAIDYRISSGASIAGTPPYMAPEVLAGEPPTPASDCYALGVLLFEALTGRPPTDDPSFRPKYPGAPPSGPLPALPTGTPADIDELVRDLIMAPAADRPDAEDVADRIEVEVASRPIVWRRSPLRRYGRDREVQWLIERLTDATLAGTVTVVAGPPGIGKTTMIRSALTQLPSQPDVLVLRSVCHPEESLPFRAVDGLIDAIVRDVQQSPTRGAALPPEAAVLPTIFPVFRELTGPVAVVAIDPQEARSSVFRAFRSLIDALARARRVVLWVDDLQWADDDSVALLHELLAVPRPPARFVLSHRGERSTPVPAAVAEVLASASGAGDVETVELGALDRDACREVIREILADLDIADGAFIESLIDQAEGNPLILIEMATGVRMRGEALVQEATRFEALVARRMMALPPSAYQLLRALAVVAQPLEEQLLPSLVDDAAATADALRVLRYEGLVKSVVAYGRAAIEVVHKRVCDALRADLAPAEVQAVHLRVAAALDARRFDDPQRLVDHLVRGGNTARAAALSVPAADKAFKSLAFNQAARLYTVAIDHGPVHEVDETWLWVQRGRSLINAGRGAEGARDLARAADLLVDDRSDSLAGLRLRRQAAEHYLRSGVTEEGYALMKDVLARLQLPFYDTNIGVAAALIWQQLSLKVRDVMPPNEEEQDLTPLQEERLASLWAAGLGLNIMDQLRSAELALRHAIASRRLGAIKHQAKALSTLGLVASWMGGAANLARGKRLRAWGDRLAERCADANTSAHVQLINATTAYYEARYEDAAHLCREGVRFCREACIGASWELANFQLVLGCTLQAIGSMAELQRHVPEILREAEARGDRYASVLARMGPLNLAWLAADKPQTAKAELERALAGPFPKNYTWQLYWGAYSSSHLALYEGRVEDAWSTIHRALPELEKRHMMRLIQSRLELNHLLGRAALAQASACDSDRGRRRWLRVVSTAIAKLEKERAAWIQPYADGLSAGVAASRSRVDEACRRLEDAESGFRAHGVQLYAIVVRRGAAKLKGDHRAVEDLDRQMMALGVANPDRWAQMQLPLVIPDGRPKLKSRPEARRGSN